MARTLDEFDRQIIALLNRNGRLSNVEIGRSLGLAEGTVRKRVDRLLSEGIIRIMAVAEPAKLGLKASVFIAIQTDLGQLHEVAHRLAAIPEVHRVSIVTGTNDVIIEAVLPSAERLLSFLIDTVSMVPGVRRTETSHVLQVVKQACDWTVPGTLSARSGPSDELSRLSDQVMPGAIVVT